MSNESTTPGPAAQSRPRLPQFDPNAQDTEAVPAVTSELPVSPPSTSDAYAVTPAPAGAAPLAGPSVPPSATGLPQRTGPTSSWGKRLSALLADEPGPGNGVPADAAGRWSAKKSAVTAGLAIVLASAGALGAAAAMPASSDAGDSFRGPGAGRSFPLPGNGQPGFGRQNQQLPDHGVDPFQGRGSSGNGQRSGSDGATST